MQSTMGGVGDHGRTEGRAAETRPLTGDTDRSMPDPAPEPTREILMPAKKQPSTIDEEMGSFGDDKGSSKQDRPKIQESPPQATKPALPKIQPQPQEVGARPVERAGWSEPAFKAAPAPGPGPVKQERTPEELALPRNLDSAMMTAIANGDSTGVEDTLMMGDVGVNDVLDLKTGFTALHTAAAYGQRDIATFLIEVVGADTLVRDNQGKGPAEVAAKYGHRKLSEEILSYVPAYMSDRGQTNGGTHKPKPEDPYIAPASSWRDEDDDFSHPKESDPLVKGSPSRPADSSFVWMKEQNTNFQSIVLPSENKFEYGFNQNLPNDMPGGARALPGDSQSAGNRSEFVYLKEDELALAASREPPRRVFESNSTAVPGRGASTVQQQAITFSRSLYPSESQGKSGVLETASLGRGLYAA